MRDLDDITETAAPRRPRSPSLRVSAPPREPIGVTQLSLTSPFEPAAALVGGGLTEQHRVYKYPFFSRR